MKLQNRHQRWLKMAFVITLLVIAGAGAWHSLKANDVPKPLAADDLLPIQTLRLEITQLQMRMQPLQQALNEKLQALNAEVTRVQDKYNAAGCQPDLQGAWNCTERERAAAQANINTSPAQQEGGDEQ